MIKAQYTVVLKSLLDNPESKACIDKALSSYPLYVKKSKEEFIPTIVPTREQLNEKILNYYKYREIGFETPARFFDELEIAMKEIMPYYNQLFLTTDNDFNMIYNVDYTRDIKRELEGSGTTEQNGSTSNTSETTENIKTDTENTSTNTTTATDKTEQNTSMGDTAKMVHSDTPQSELSITGEDIDSVSYADSVQWNKNSSSSDTVTEGENSSTGTTTSEGSNTTNGTNTATQNGNTSVTGEDTKTEEEITAERVKGNYGQVSYQRLIAQYREIILNVEQKIIRDRRIQELFMLVY